MKKTIAYLFVVCFLMVGCNPVTADYDIRGAWEYTMIATDGNTYDIGTIQFTGNSATSGEYSMENIYQVVYQGAFEVNGVNLVLSGQEEWKGVVETSDKMAGTWDKPEDEASGTWTATRVK